MEAHAAEPESTLTGDFPPPRDPLRPLDPPPELLRRLRDQPISKIRLWDGSEAWLITRYVDGRAVLSDDRFSADPRNPGYPEKSAIYNTTIGQDRNIRVLDNPEHDAQKRMMVRDFTVKRVNEIRPHVQEIVNSLIDRMLETGPPADFVSQFATPVPTVLICELLGVPYDERTYFGHRSKALLSAPTVEDAALAGAEMSAYMERMIDLKLARPGNDLISRLVHEQMKPGYVTRADIVSTCRLMLLAGHSTTAAMIGLSTLVFLTDPAAGRQIRERSDAEFVRNAVEEMLRYINTVHSGRRRVAISDVHIGDHIIRAGEGVIVMNNVMDRDETAFERASEVDLNRPNARYHTAFGFGIHQCLGQLLARMELQVVHGTLWKRIPTLTLAAQISDLRFSTGPASYELKALPVAW